MMCLTRRPRRKDPTIRIDLFTREYLPHIYGGAGAHILELVKVLCSLVDDLRVQTFDDPYELGTDGADPGVTEHADLPQLVGTNAALRMLGIDLEIVAACGGSDLVYSHTWYANFAGHVASFLGDILHVISAHSFEPLCPWKVEQFGGGYHPSPYMEKAAYGATSATVATSNGVRDDILRYYPGVDPERVRVIHDGIDLNKWHAPEGEAGEELRARVLVEHGVDPSHHTVMLVDRITRRKGLPYFLRIIQLLPDDVQLALCAGAPDTPGIAAEIEGLVTKLCARRSGVILISEMLPQPEVAAIPSSAQALIMLSVHEPLGIVNLEAMVLGLPVVGTATNGIPDVVIDRKTGYLALIEQKKDGTGTPLDPHAFEEAMADRLVRILDDPKLGRHMGKAGLIRARDHFSRKAIGVKTAELYHLLVQDTRRPMDDQVGYMVYALNLSYVSLQRGDMQVLSDASWSMRPRQHWVTVGPNGVGKTTLTRVASGRIAPDSGEVTVSETNSSHADSSKIATRVGLSPAVVGTKIMLTQPVLSTMRSIAWGLTVAHEEGYEAIDDERAHVLMDIFGASRLARCESSTLSEGKAQRVLLIHALVTDPEVFILDGPISSPDLGARELLIAALSKIMQGSKSPQVILVTHQVGEIPVGVTRYAVISNGIIMYQGPIEDVLTNVSLSEVCSMLLFAGYTDGRWQTRGMSAREQECERYVVAVDSRRPPLRDR